MLTENQILEILELWKGKPEFELKDRDLTNLIIKKINKEIIDLIGVRRSGKSSLLFLLIKKLNLDDESFLYVNFEEPLFIGHYSIELLDKIWATYQIHFAPTQKPYLFLDEVQHIPRWEQWARRMRDLELAHLFITGSSSKLLSREFGTSLTGRHLSLTVFPLSFREFTAFRGARFPSTQIELVRDKISLIRLLEEYLQYGGLPEVVLTKSTDLLGSYFEDMLYKDVVIRHEVRDVNSLRRLAVYCLTNISNEISYNSLRKQFSISLESAKNYMSYLEESFLIFIVPFFSYSLNVQERMHKKIYCIDNGLRNKVSFKFSQDKGRLAENLVFVELKRRGLEPYYWRGKGEVDFVVKNKDQTLFAINVTYTDEVPERELKALEEFKTTFGKKVKKLLILTKDTEMEKNNITYVPLWKWLLVNETKNLSNS